MLHEILPVGILQCNCHIFGDETSHQAMVIDPGDEIDRILQTLTRHGLTVTAIVITHAHIDHLGGAQKLKLATGSPVYMNLADSELQDMLDVQAGWLGMRIPEAVDIDVPLKDGDKLLIGATEVHVLHTPGHTQGSICLWMPAERKLVAGDTLFRESIGRTDLPGGDSRQILESIHGQLMCLPGDTDVFPGHGDPTTIAREKRSNFFLQGLR